MISESIKRYIEYHRHKKKAPMRLNFDFRARAQARDSSFVYLFVFNIIDNIVYNKFYFFICQEKNIKKNKKIITFQIKYRQRCIGAKNSNLTGISATLAPHALMKDTENMYQR